MGTAHLQDGHGFTYDTETGEISDPTFQGMSQDFENLPDTNARLTALEEDVEDMKFMVSAILAQLVEPQISKVRDRIRSKRKVEELYAEYGISVPAEVLLILSFSEIEMYRNLVERDNGTDSNE